MYSIPKPLRRICVANRGEIVERVCRTANRMGIETTSIYTEPDHNLGSALYNRVNLSLGPSTQGYIDIDKVVRTAKQAGCDSIHPGYGFLSENVQFAKKVRDEGLIFIGPPVTAIQDMGAKDKSKEIMEAAGVPCVPGYHGTNQDPQFLLEKAKEIKFPVLIKAVLGGGGKGMRIVETESDFLDKLESAKSEAQASFGDSNVLIEKYITTPRHIEVQVFADKFGNTVAIGERDCSVQRRHQKVLEESPAPGLDPKIRQDLWEKARAAARAVKYEGAGTVEFIFDNDTNEFFFMEMNTRLQVEHPVSEQVSNEDLVEWQLLIAAGFPLPKSQEELEFTGHAIEARIYCEDAFNGFLPSSGRVSHMRIPITGNPRCDFSFIEGDEITVNYDPMIGKLIVHGRDRQEALAKMNFALEELEIVGPITNIEFIKRIVSHPNFDGNNPENLETGFIPKNPDLLESKPVPDKVLAQAAIASILNDAPATPTTFRAISGWNTFERTIEYSVGDEQVRVTVRPKTGVDQSYWVYIGDGKEPLNVLSAEYSKGEHKLYVRFDSSQAINSAVVLPTSVHVFDNGTHYTLETARPKWLEDALGVSGAENSVSAPMPCTVSRVHVSVGDEVKKDQELVVILSMKMETTIRSPVDGKVKRICKPGDQLKQGTVMVEFEEDSETSE